MDEDRAKSDEPEEDSRPQDDRALEAEMEPPGEELPHGVPIDVGRR